jgi:hypothetical protein
VSTGKVESMKYISRNQWWNWTEKRRASWNEWFEAHGYSPRDITDFYIGPGVVEVVVLQRDDEGKPIPNKEERHGVESRRLSITDFDQPIPSHK